MKKRDIADGKINAEFATIRDVIMVSANTKRE